LTDGDDLVIVAYGPVLLTAAVQAAEMLRDRKGVGAKVINLPWLNRIDCKWLLTQVGGTRKLVLLDNHYLDGGQGQRIAAALAVNGDSKIALHHIGLDRIPACGSNNEVLREHHLDADSIYCTLAAIL
jgi:transketolase